MSALVRHARPVFKATADDRDLSVTAVLSWPLTDAAGDVVLPEGLDFEPHRSDPWVDIEHTGTRVGWARKSLSRPGGRYGVRWADLDLDGTTSRLPVGTTWFDPNDRLSMQTFALVKQDALPGVSLEFYPVKGFAKAIGWSDLDGRPAYEFARADVVRWTHCARPVNAGALVAKSMPGQVPPPLAKILTDKRVGGEPLHPVLYKALSPYTPAKAATVTGGYEQPSDAVKKARQPFHGGYWEDNCPECGNPAESGCRCIRNDRFCANGHTWERLTDGMPALLDKGHGKVIKSYDGSSLADAESRRRTWTKHFQAAVEKAMDDENLMTADAGAATAYDDAPDAPEESGGDEGQTSPTAQAAYDAAQQVADACVALKAALASSEHIAGKKKLMAVCDQMEKLAEKLTGTGDMVHDDVYGDDAGGMDEDDDEPEVEADATEPDEENDGLMKAFRKPVRKAYGAKVRRFTPAEIEAGVKKAEAGDAELDALRRKNERLKRKFEKLSARNN